MWDCGIWKHEVDTKWGKNESSWSSFPKNIWETKFSSVRTKKLAKYHSKSPIPGLLFTLAWVKSVSSVVWLQWLPEVSIICNELISLHLTKISRGLFALIYSFVDIVVNLQLLIRCLPDIHPWPHCLPPICRPLWKQVTPSVLCWYPLCEQCYYCCYKLWCQ